MKDQGVRVVVAYQQFSVGRILFPPGALRQKLIERGLVEPVGTPSRKPAKTDLLRR